jgi:putative oxidoreductase
MPEGLLVIRIVVGLLLVGHGTQKLFGWFGGHGLAGTGGFFEQVGHRPGRPMAAVAGMSEAGGGTLLALGLFTPLGAATVLGVMTVAAVSVHAPNGLWASAGGFELPLIYALVAVGLGFTGGGTWSLDHLAGWDLAGWGWGLCAVLLGLVTAGLALARRNRVMDRVGHAGAYPPEPAAADTRQAHSSR